MRWTASTLAALALAAPLVQAAASAAPAPPAPNKENTMPGKSGSRIPAPAVAPVSADGVRYEQVRNGLLAGLDQMGGYLAAVDEGSGRQLWTLKVYDNRRDPQREGDVQDVFFKSMQRQPDGTLLVENERGARFVVDLVRRTSTPAR